MDRRVYDNYVIQIAKHGSLTKAASALGISQPALSSGLSSLEKDLGITIFNRRTTPISFTAEGEIYYEYIKRVKVLFNDMYKRVDSIRGDYDKQLTIGAPVAYTDSLVSEVIVQLLKDHPDYTVAVKSAPLSELLEMASSGEINCFVSTSDELPTNFEAQQIKREQLYLCVPSDRKVNASLGQSMEQLSVLDGEEFILLEQSQPLQKDIELLLSSNGIKAERRITVNQVSTAVNLAIRGAGICIASEDSLANNWDNKAICIYPLHGKGFGRDIFIAYDKEFAMPTACADFIELIKK